MRRVIAALLPPFEAEAANRGRLAVGRFQLGAAFLNERLVDAATRPAGTVLDRGHESRQAGRQGIHGDQPAEA